MQMLRLICAANTLADSIIIICIRIKSCFICMHIFSLTLRRRLFHSAYHDDDTSARNNGVSFSPPHNRWIRSSRCIAAQWDEVSFLHCHVTGGKFFENDRFILKSGKSPSVYKKTTQTHANHSYVMAFLTRTWYAQNISWRILLRTSGECHFTVRDPPHERSGAGINLKFATDVHVGPTRRSNLEGIFSKLSTLESLNLVKLVLKLRHVLVYTYYPS